MKKIRSFLFISFILIAVIQVNGFAENKNNNSFSKKNFQINKKIFEKAVTQADINEAAYREYDRSRKLMKKIFKNIIADYSKNKKFIKKIIVSQKCWERYLAAHLDAIFPVPDNSKRLYYGSSFSMDYYMVKSMLTLKRAKELNAWLNDRKNNSIQHNHYRSIGAKNPPKLYTDNTDK